jgi:hypothetical protein
MLARIIALFVLAAAAPASGQKFYPDDPISVDRDDLPIEKPGIIELSPTYDLLSNTFARPEAPPVIPRAGNVNTLGEVPDSSWFQNRIGVREMSLDELARGPNTDPPLLPFTIVAAKASGITPGFTVRDATGRTFFVKFDPKEHPNLTTGADVIGKSFFHAIGYNVPEAFLVYLRAGDLTIGPGAKVRLEGDKAVPMDAEFLDSVLDNAGRHPGGSARSVFSRAVEGEVLGQFQFRGTRPDDANDIIPHEDRRELRGYRVFCAWLNHDDSRAINTLDAFVSAAGGRGYVRHYLIDFGSTLGSGSDNLRRIAPQDPRSGNEFVVDFEPTWTAAYTLGIRDRPWRGVRYAYPLYAEVGRIESEFFEPSNWKPEYPNPAFDRLLADDGFWAAKIVARFSDEAVRAIVETGDYLSEDAEDFLTEIIARRRDKVVAHYFLALDPLDGFEAEDALTFRHLGVEHGLGAVQGYRYEWFGFDNETGETTPLGASGLAGEVGQARIPIPDTGAPYLLVRIRSISDRPSWGKAVDVYLRGRTVVGIEREI